MSRKGMDSKVEYNKSHPREKMNSHGSNKSSKTQKVVNKTKSRLAKAIRG